MGHSQKHMVILFTYVYKIHRLCCCDLAVVCMKQVTAHLNFAVIFTGLSLHGCMVTPFDSSIHPTATKVLPQVQIADS